MTPKLEFNLTMPCSTVFSRKPLTKVQTPVTVCPQAPRWSSPSPRAPPPARPPAQVGLSGARGGLRVPVLAAARGLLESPNKTWSLGWGERD